MKLSLKGLKVTGVTKIGLIALAVAFVLWLVLTYAFDAPTKLAGKVDPNACPDCGNFLTQKERDRGECPYCKAKGKGGDLTKRDTTAKQASRVVPWVLIGGFVLLLAVHVGFVVKGWVGKGKDEVLYHLNCRKCDRKIRYRQGQIDHFAQCPRCRAWVRFPAPPAPKRKNLWVQLKGWLTPRRAKKQATPTREA
jgi:predicted Zn-ribbon and HTH transcriptional regulator